MKNILKKYGYNTISYQSLIGGLEYFMDDRYEGYIAYKKIKKTYLAIGDPICKEEDILYLSHSFREFIKKKKWYCSFLSVSEKFQKQLEMLWFGTLKIGEEAIFNLKEFTLQGSKMRNSRNLVSRAEREWIKISIIQELSQKIKTDIDDLNIKWEKTRKVGGFSFLLTLDPFKNFEDKLMLSAYRWEKLVWYISAVPIYNRKWFYFEDIIRSEKAPLWTNHLMVYWLLEYMKQQWYEMASLWTSPLWNIEKRPEERFKKTHRLLKFLYNRVNMFYNFKWLHHFKKSMCPNSWEEKYVAFYPARLRPKLFLSIAKAYNPKGITGIVASKITKEILPKKNNNIKHK